LARVRVAEAPGWKRFLMLYPAPIWGTTSRCFFYPPCLLKPVPLTSLTGDAARTARDSIVANRLSMRADVLGRVARIQVQSSFGRTNMKQSPQCIYEQVYCIADAPSKATSHLGAATMAIERTS